MHFNEIFKTKANIRKRVEPSHSQRTAPVSAIDERRSSVSYLSMGETLLYMSAYNIATKRLSKKSIVSTGKSLHIDVSVGWRGDEIFTAKSIVLYKLVWILHV